MVFISFIATLVMNLLFPGSGAAGHTGMAGNVIMTENIGMDEETGVHANVHPARYDRKFREAVSLYDRGMYVRASEIFTEICAADDADMEAEGWRVLCHVRMASKGYEKLVAGYIDEYPFSGLIPQIRFYHALNLFDMEAYDSALQIFDKVARAQLYKKQVSEFLFKKAYSTYESGNYDLALQRFKEVESRPVSDYTAPSRYSLGYINYLQSNFSESASWFEKAAKDYRFAGIAGYYLFECKFMLKDYGYVMEKGPKMLEKVPEDRVHSLMRLISESFLVTGDAESARHYYEMNKSSETLKDREDFFYAGSLLFAVKDYQAAIDKYSMMTERTDSIGQIANYNMGYSYIQTKNKVAAMEAFKSASEHGPDAVIAKDARFNYAKLAFDLNNDSSAFDEYLKRYPDTKRGDRIYSYIAMAALYNRDYAGAVAAYDNIDELDTDMRSNYMKANYLRANQLIEGGAWRSAIPYLKAAAWYSDKKEPVNQLSRYWLAESYYRDNRYSEASAIFNELYNTSALYGMPESSLVSYGIAYCAFKQENWQLADKWFTKYLSGNAVKFKKEALLRKGDCLFIQKKYQEAFEQYSEVVNGYFDVNDIYPYYQAAISVGLTGDVNRKVQLLSRVNEADASAAFYPEAMFELGRSYVNSSDNQKAEQCFNRLLTTVRDSTYMAGALVELGTLSRNNAKTDKALEYYKKVVEQFPLSGYADDALLAIEAVYQSENNPDAYLDYINSIGKSSLKTEDEKEMMIFNAAEQIFLSENYRKALVSLQSYLDRYPSGEKVSQAEFYLAESYKALGLTEKAADSYAKVMEMGAGSFLEISTLNYANLSFSLQKYEDAYNGYSALSENAQIKNNVFTAKLGMMRSAYLARLYPEAVAAAVEVAADSRSSADILEEASYTQAKSKLAMSRREEAFVIFESLAANPASDYGAEAAYLVIQDIYDRGLFEEVENKVYAFAEVATNDYWLAKSFVVLGDSFVERDDYEQAKATYESVLSGYAPSKEDDVVTGVRMRLEKLKKLMTNE